MSKNTGFQLKDHLAYVLARPVQKIGPWFYVTEPSLVGVTATPRCTLVTSDALLSILKQEHPTSLLALSHSFALACSGENCHSIKTDPLEVKMILVGLLNEKRISQEFVNRLVFG